MNTPLYAAILLAGSVLGLSACGGSADAPAAEAGANAIAGVEVANARLVLPPVSGNPAAIYLDLSNNSDRNLAFRSAEVSKAKSAEIHDTIEQNGEMVMGPPPPVMVEKGGTAKFEPGARHIMVFELDPTVKAGDKLEVTLIAAGGKRHSFEATAQAAGDDR